MGSSPPTMTKIITKHSCVAGHIPYKLELGELGVNAEDGILYFKSPDGMLNKIVATPLETHLDPTSDPDAVVLFLMAIAAITWTAVCVLLVAKALV